MTTKVTMEQLEYWYRKQEEAKAELPYGSDLGRRYYYESPHEPFATIALILTHLMFCWECDHELPPGSYWSFTIPEGLICQVRSAGGSE